MSLFFSLGPPIARSLPKFQSIPVVPTFPLPHGFCIAARTADSSRRKPSAWVMMRSRLPLTHLILDVEVEVQILNGEATTEL